MVIALLTFVFVAAAIVARTGCSSSDRKKRKKVFRRRLMGNVEVLRLNAGRTPREHRRDPGRYSVPPIDTLITESGVEVTVRRLLIGRQARQCCLP